MNPLNYYLRRIPAWVLHLSVWLSYTFFIYMTNLLPKPDVTFLKVLFFQLPFYATFYLCLFCLHIYKTRGVATGLSLYAAIFFMLAAAAYYYMYHLLPGAGLTLYSSDDFRLFLGNAILGYFQYSLYAMLYFYFMRTIRHEQNLRYIQEEKSSLEKMKILQDLENALLKEQELTSQKEKLQYEFAFLRSQINPHFLYNTLNVLFSQALNVSEGLADNIMKLSEIMRYSLGGGGPDNSTVPVEQELDQMQNLLDIHMLRFGKTKTVRYIIEGQADGHKIPPLSIITVVENAFKYGDLKDPAYPLEILVRFSPDQLFFYCRNKKRKSIINPRSLNIGMTNLSKRLDVAFTGKYEMRAENGDFFYTFELTIKK